MTAPLVLRWVRTTAAPLLAVWDALSDTDRLNRLAGLDFTFSAADPSDPQSRGTGSYRHLGQTVRWQERPVQFVAPRHLVIERVYDNGPLHTARTTLTLEPHGTATEIHLTATLQPRHAWARAALVIDSAVHVEPALGRALDEILDSLAGEGRAEPRDGGRLGAAARLRLEERLARVQRTAVAQRLAHFLDVGGLDEQRRIRPLRLAKRWQLPAEEVTAGLLEAAAAGVLTVRWELLCPSCRLPAETATTLELQGAHCPTCDVRYDANFADAVALTLQPDPAIRSNLGTTRCLSSPAGMPHVVGQVTVAPRSELSWSLDLLAGSYRIRTWPGLGETVLTLRDGLRSGDHAGAARDDAHLHLGPVTLNPPALVAQPGRVTLRLRSKSDQPVTVLVERPWREPDLLSVGQVLQWPAARACLPPHSLGEGWSVEPCEVYAIAVQVWRGGDAAAQQLGDALMGCGVRALQVSSGWVLASLADGDGLVRACDLIQGAAWLTAAVGHGAVVELATPTARLACGALMQQLVAAAAAAALGEVRAVVSAGVKTVAGLCLQATGDGGTEALVLQRKATPLAVPAHYTRPLDSGDTIDGRFVLGQLLGEGAFGVVYAAQDQQAGDDVVVKLLRDSVADTAELVQRFFDEGQLAARLRGRNVVQVREWGLADDGRLFLCMERLHGRELSAILRDLGTLDPHRALRLVDDALQGLAEAHRHGLVHRDIKPGNLFVVDDGGSGEHLKVIDFGIAIDRSGRVRNLDQPGMLIGTPLYMSPEQASGGPLDGRSDLYAVAVVLFQCLSGQVPFEGATPMANLLARLQTPPRDLRTCTAQPLPPGVAALVAGALAREPQRRPADAATMSADVRRLLATMGDGATWRASWGTSRRQTPRTGTQPADGLRDTTQADWTEQTALHDAVATAEPRPDAG